MSTLPPVSASLTTIETIKTLNEGEKKILKINNNQKSYFLYKISSSSIHLNLTIIYNIQRFIIVQLGIV